MYMHLTPKRQPEGTLLLTSTVSCIGDRPTGKRALEAVILVLTVPLPCTTVTNVNQQNHNIE